VTVIVGADDVSRLDPCSLLSDLGSTRRRQWPDSAPIPFFMALNDHPQSVPVAICRAKALVVLRALPCGSITCRGRAEQVAIYLVVEETLSSKGRGESLRWRSRPDERSFPIFSKDWNSGRK